MKTRDILSQPSVGDLVVSVIRLGCRLTVGGDKVFVQVLDFGHLGDLGGIDLLAVELQHHAQGLEMAMADKRWPRVEESLAIGFVMGGPSLVC